LVLRAVSSNHWGFGSPITESAPNKGKLGLTR